MSRFLSEPVEDESMGCLLNWNFFQDSMVLILMRNKKNLLSPVRKCRFIGKGEKFGLNIKYKITWIALFSFCQKHVIHVGAVLLPSFWRSYLHQALPYWRPRCSELLKIDVNVHVVVAAGLGWRDSIWILSVMFIFLPIIFASFNIRLI